MLSGARFVKLMFPDIGKKRVPPGQRTPFKKRQLMKSSASARQDASANSLPDFELDLFGNLDAAETERVEELISSLEDPFRPSPGCAEEQEFLDLMNKSYPNALFTRSIFVSFSEKEDNYWKYDELGEVPEFRDWWEQAHVLPSTAGVDTENMLVDNEEDPDTNMDQVRSILASSNWHADNHD